MAVSVRNGVSLFEILIRVITRRVLQRMARWPRAPSGVMAAPTTRTGAFAELLEHNAVATVFAKLGGGMIKFKFHFQTELNIPCESP